MLSIEWCIGIIGGRPKSHSLWSHPLHFVGYQDDKLIHHTTVKTLKMSIWRTFRSQASPQRKLKAKISFLENR
jgi:hypothetical protein